MSFSAPFLPGSLFDVAEIPDPKWSRPDGMWGILKLQNLKGETLMTRSFYWLMTQSPYKWLVQCPENQQITRDMMIWSTPIIKSMGIVLVTTIWLKFMANAVNVGNASPMDPSWVRLFFQEVAINWPCRQHTILLSSKLIQCLFSRVINSYKFFLPTKTFTFHDPEHHISKTLPSLKLT